MRRKLGFISFSFCMRSTRMPLGLNWVTCVSQGLFGNTWQAHLLLNVGGNRLIRLNLSSVFGPDWN